MAQTIDECCGNCKYHESQGYDYFVCCNPDSEGYALETDYSDYCDEYENKYDE